MIQDTTAQREQLCHTQQMALLETFALLETSVKEDLPSMTHMIQMVIQSMIHNGVSQDTMKAEKDLTSAKSAQKVSTVHKIVQVVVKNQLNAVLVTVQPSHTSHNSVTTVHMPLWRHYD